jgi:hypothetical protein
LSPFFGSPFWEVVSTKSPIKIKNKIKNEKNKKIKKQFFYPKYNQMEVF